MKLKDISKAILPPCGRRSGRCQGYLPYLQGGPEVPASPGGRAGPGVPSLQVGHQIRWGPATWMISINSGYLLDISNVQSIAEAISVKRKRIYLYGSRKRVVFFFNQKMWSWRRAALSREKFLIRNVALYQDVTLYYLRGKKKNTIQCSWHTLLMLEENGVRK